MSVAELVAELVAEYPKLVLLEGITCLRGLLCALGNMAELSAGDGLGEAKRPTNKRGITALLRQLSFLLQARTHPSQKLRKGSFVCHPVISDVGLVLLLLHVCVGAGSRVCLAGFAGGLGNTAELSAGDGL